MKFKAELVRSYKASDGTVFESRDSLAIHERTQLCERLGDYTAGDFEQALRAGDLIVGREVPARPEVVADIFTLAALLRPPRAKKGSKTGQSASDPISTNAGSTIAAIAAAPTSTVGNGATAGTSEGQSERPLSVASEVSSPAATSEPAASAGDAPHTYDPSHHRGQSDTDPITATKHVATADGSLKTAMGAGHLDDASATTTVSHRSRKAREGAAT